MIEIFDKWLLQKLRWIPKTKNEPNTMLDKLIIVGWLTKMDIRALLVFSCLTNKLCVEKEKKISG